VAHGNQTHLHFNALFVVMPFFGVTGSEKKMLYLEIFLALLAMVLAAIAGSVYYASYRRVLALVKGVGDVLTFVADALADDVLSREEAEEIVSRLKKIRELIGG